MLISGTLITHCLYWVIIVAITFVMPRVGAVGTSLERRNHYRPHLMRAYFSDVNMLTVYILGAAIAWKRVAWLNIRNRRPRAYDSQRLEKQSLGKAITDTFELRRLDMIHFGSVAVIIDLTFTFVAAKNFRKDIDNLIKFVLDAMQLSGVFDNDAQVVEVRANKKCYPNLAFIDLLKMSNTLIMVISNANKSDRYFVL